MFVDKRVHISRVFTKRFLNGLCQTYSYQIKVSNDIKQDGACFHAIMCGFTILLPHRFHNTDRHRHLL